MQPLTIQRTPPKIWLMTDKRNDAVLDDSLRRLPRGSGIIFRHYHLEEDDRARRFVAVRKIARQRNHLAILAGEPSLAKAWGADGVHGRMWTPLQTSDLFHSAPVHNAREIREARASHADAFFLSPAFPTRSHPDRSPLGTAQLRRLIGLCDRPVILLGGMNAKRFRQYASLGAWGWAAIDALSD